MSGPSNISGGGYRPLDPLDFETRDIEGVGAHAPVGGNERKWRRQVVRSVTAKPLAGIRTTLAQVSGRETEGTRAREAPIFRMTARDGGSDIQLHVELARDMGSSPPKVLTTFNLWEEGGEALVALSPDGTLESNDTPGYQLLLLPDRERLALRARQMIGGVLEQGGTNRDATERELKDALKLVDGIDRWVGDAQRLVRKSPEAGFAIAAFARLGSGGPIDATALRDLERDLAVARRQLDGRAGLSDADRATIAEALDTVQRRVAEKLGHP